jgi:phosphoserine phosphatase RsbU/P
MLSAETALLATPIFQSLSPVEMDFVLAHLRPLDLPAGKVLFEENQPGDSLFIILEGHLEVVKALGSPDERVVARRGPGEYVGEMCLFALDRLRSASMRAAEQTRLLELGRADFDIVLLRCPRLAYDMVRVLNDRLKESHNSAMRDLKEKNRQLQRAYDELQLAQAQIIEKKKLEHELALAHDIQMSMLPHQMPAFPGFDFGARILPMAAVGGDFYDFIPLGKDRLGIAIGDVSGHGVPAALFMALTVSLLRSEASRECSPIQALRSVNRQMIHLNGEGMFVTLLFGVLDCTTGDFAFARAGHGLPLVARADGRVEEMPLKHGMALGLFEEASFSEQTLTLSPGDALLLYTDGVTEAMDVHRVLYGDERLKAAFGAVHRQPAQEVCEQIFSRAAAFSDSDVPSDDVTIVCVQACLPVGG